MAELKGAQTASTGIGVFGISSMHLQLVDHHARRVAIMHTCGLRTIILHGVYACNTLRRKKKVCGAPRACLLHSATGTRTRVARVRAEYPNQLDYGGIE